MACATRRPAFAESSPTGWTEELLTGPILAVHLFTAIDVANSLLTIRALLDAAEAQALELGCAAVRIRLHDGQAELAVPITDFRVIVRNRSILEESESST